MKNTCNNIVVLISGNGSNLQAIVNSIETGQISATIKAVISNRVDAKGLVFAASKGIDTHIVDNKNFPDRQAFDAALINVIDQYQPKLIVLAGFMRVLTPSFVEHYLGRLINIHPSLLPKYPGLHTHRQVLQAKDNQHGCSVHFVTKELDGGPIIIQATITIDSDMSEELLAKRVHILEHKIYPLAIQWFIDHQLHFVDGRIYLNQNLLPPNGYRYNEEL